MDAPPVQYVTTSDGYTIAYAVSGESIPLVFVPPTFSNVQLVWRFYPDWLEGLAARFRLIQYDSRGEGMSTRGLPQDLSFSDFDRDIEAVIDRLKPQKLILWGWGSRAHIAVRYAVAHPERVQALILHTCAASNAAWKSDIFDVTAETWEFLLRSLAGMNAQGQTREELVRLHDDFRTCVTYDDFRRMQHVSFASSVEAVLPKLAMPVLVLHQREHFTLAPEESMKLAAMIPNGRFVLLDTHAMFGNANQGLAAIDRFLNEALPVEVAVDALQPHLPGRLSQREIEVLRLVAAGRSNQQIADQLVISLNTVRRHVSNVFDKTGVANRTEASVYARDRGLA